MALIRVGSFIESSSWLKKRCLVLSKRLRAAAFAPPFSVLPSISSTTPVSASASSMFWWIIAYREVAVMRRNAA
jgi:hypothetical protein